jgi:DNA-binding NarL/FixJ family response regulator
MSHLSDNKEISVLIADDHPAMVDVASRLLERGGMKPCGTASDGIEALEKIEALRPMVALLDLKMPGLDGLEVARKAARVSPETQVVIYTGFADHAQLTEALDSGVKGFVNKEGPLDDLVRAVGAVASGGTYIDPVLAGNLVVTPNASPQLSKREREVLRHLAEGMSNEEIGKELFLSPETVRTHVRNAMVKLGARTRLQAVVMAMRTSLIA